ncbi:MAG TPA: hypothetical protein VEA59_03515 [Patescibacteria group bacterium]|nr:hypothetical protein [Patescibacteria group bacterium]
MKKRAGFRIYTTKPQNGEILFSCEKCKGTHAARETEVERFKVDQHAVVTTICDDMSVYLNPLIRNLGTTGRTGGVLGTLSYFVWKANT